jgi:hypothetical protein
MSTPTIAPRLLLEPVSPFAEPSAAEARIDDLLPSKEPNSLLMLVRDPEAVAKRLLHPDSQREVITTAVLGIAIGTAIFAIVAGPEAGPFAAARAAVLLAFNTFAGLIAALGPIYATSLLVAARIPLHRLVGVLLASAATGALLLGGLAPIALLLGRIDPVWAGPLALLGAFAIAGLTAGARIYRLLHLVAKAVRRYGTDAESPLRESELFRLKILARMALVIASLTGTLALWAFDPFLGG